MRRLRAWFVLAVAVVLTGLWLVPADAVTQTANVVARNAHGVVLPPDPLLRRGDRVQLTITGFGPRAHLTVRLGTTALGTYVADASGRVQFTFVVPGYGKGGYVVAAVGTPPLRTLTPSYEPTEATRDPQGVEAIVPTLGIFTFRLDPGIPSTSPHPSTSAGGGGTSGIAGGSSGTGGLGHTGVDVAALLIAAAVGVLGGALILWPGRRRKHA